MKFAVALALCAVVACKKAESTKKSGAPAPTTAGTVAPDGTRAIPIAVKKVGYEPDAITAKPGEKLKLVFTRVEDTECGAQVKVDGGKAVDLPMNQPVEIAVTAPASGKLTFVCGMDMMQGAIIVGS
jgi:plastocyanin domain-containing protein